jgi:hypothetical protein
MMGPRQVEQAALFYNFSLEAHVPHKHMLRSIDRFRSFSAICAVSLRLSTVHGATFD